MTGRRRASGTQAALEAFPDEFLECRADRRHDFSWRTATFQRLRDSSSGRDMRETRRVCSRCGTAKIDRFWENIRRQRGGRVEVLSAERISSRYEYPDDYLVVGFGLAAIESADVLVEIWRRFPGEEVE
jgi:hypothetical protein